MHEIMEKYMAMAQQVTEQVTTLFNTIVFFTAFHGQPEKIQSGIVLQQGLPERPKSTIGPTIGLKWANSMPKYSN